MRLLIRSPSAEAPSRHQELTFDQDAERVGSLTVAARSPDDPFGLRAGNAVLSSEVADLVGSTTGHPPAVPPASIRSVIGHGTLLLSSINEFARRCECSLCAGLRHVSKELSYLSEGGVRRSERDEPRSARVVTTSFQYARRTAEVRVDCCGSVHLPGKESRNLIFKRTLGSEASPARHGSVR